MKITLTVEKCPDPALTGSRMAFGEEGGSIGRAADNDWVLPDPNFYTSGKHARIRRDGDGFVVEDLSTNGTFHNSPDNLIGKSRSATLSEGDRLHIGEFVIVVSLDKADPVVGGATATVDGDEDDEPLLEPDPAQPPPTAPERDEFDDLLESRRHADPGPSDAKDSDLPFAAGGERDSMGLDLDPDESDADTGSTDPVGSGLQQSPEREYFSAPGVSSQPEDDIPDEWDALLTGFFEPPSDQKSSPSRTSSGAGHGPESKSKPEPEPEPEPERQERQKQRSSDSIGVKPSPPRPERVRSERRPEPPPRRAVRPDQSGVAASILHELGIGELAGDIDADDFAEQIGKVVRMVGEGLMQLLASRAEIKNEFRIDQTRISSVQNNPLKFSPTTEEAMRRVFVERDTPGFISGAEAFELALNDLRAHQVAILAAVQGAIESIILQFDPAQLEGKLKKISPISASAPLIREAKCWNLFTSHYEEMAANLRHDAKRVFVREFAEAYERSSAEIARQIAESRGKGERGSQ
jgi:type VI secretion system protein